MLSSLELHGLKSANRCEGEALTGDGVTGRVGASRMNDGFSSDAVEARSGPLPHNAPDRIEK